MALSDKAMLVRLSIKQWSGRKLDKEITQEVNAAHGASADAGRYNKALVAKNALAEIVRIGGAARIAHYQNTLPWEDNGGRILPSKNYMEYTGAMRNLQTEFEKAAADFVAGYPAYVADARVRLNGMFKAEDYPDIDVVSGKFAFAVHVDPMPTSADFRINLSDAETARVKAEIDTRSEQATREAMADLWRRLYDSVSKLADKLGETRIDKTGKVAPSIFRDSLVGNVAELCDLLPRLNVADDPDLEAMRQAVQAQLAGKLPEELRENETERAQTAKAAADLAAAMSAYMAPPEPEPEPTE